MNANERKWRTGQVTRTLASARQLWGLDPYPGRRETGGRGFSRSILPVSGPGPAKASTSGAQRPGDGRSHAQCLSRRGFLGLCVGLLGLICSPIGTPGRQSGPAGGGDAAPPALAAGPRERALYEADFYRPHELAG
jgi:hypothetical protein